MRTFVAMLVPVVGLVLIVAGALLAAVVADTEKRTAALAFVEALGTGLVSAGAIAVGLGVVYLAWVITHPPAR
jgi:Co/Zn/Cd efflux system component